MPWEVTIKGRNDEPLGSRDEIVNAISSALPAVKWRVEPSMLEQIKDMPDHSFHTLLPTWSEATRLHMSTPHLRGDFVDNEMSIELFGFEGDPIKMIHADVRGNGNPIPALAAICLPRGWLVIDVAENREIDLAAGDSTPWEQFTQYRDRAIDSTRKSQSEPEN